MILEKIKNAEDVRRLSNKKLELLAGEIRNRIIDVVSETGGHLASSLGTVELTIALHYAYNTPNDRIIWDVGHQTYAHKLITGRNEVFDSLRQYGGMSGFPKVCESEYDCYNTGHSSTSISLALGEAVAQDLNKASKEVIAVIGDGSMTGGIAFEGLNHLGHLKKNVTIVLNDNRHSISENVGALSEYLTSIITANSYNTLKNESYKLLRLIPFIGNPIANFILKTEIGLKRLFVPEHIFEDLGIRYFGPIDGHDISKMIKVFSKVKKIGNGPKIIHVITQKGKGYKYSEKNPTKFHGVSSFDVENGNALKSKGIGFSEVAGETLSYLADSDEKITAVTAAMTEGTGLKRFSEKYPDRFFDVGIAEQHAVTFCSALANQGLKPFFAVYSTFLQRGYDQLIHDVALMDLPVKFLIDRAGIVGEDGETHHGLFDISYLKAVPNLKILNPVTGIDLRNMIAYAANYNDGPIAIRYPRGSISEKNINYADTKNKFTEYRLFDQENEKHDLCIFTYSDMYYNALGVKDELEKNGFSVQIFTILCLKPLPIEEIEKSIENSKKYVFIENAHVEGSISETVLIKLKSELRNRFVKVYGFPDEVICHGNSNKLLQHYNIDSSSISNDLIGVLGE